MSEDIKAKIRERYKGNANANIEVIPAIEQPSFYEDFSEKRVAVYARVSTGSAKNQKCSPIYFTLMRMPDWNTTVIFSSECTSMKSRVRSISE